MVERTKLSLDLSGIYFMRTLYQVAERLNMPTESMTAVQWAITIIVSQRLDFRDFDIQGTYSDFCFVTPKKGPDQTWKVELNRRRNTIEITKSFQSQFQTEPDLDQIGQQLAGLDIFQPDQETVTSTGTYSVVETDEDEGEYDGTRRELRFFQQGRWRGVKKQRSGV